MNTFLSFFLGFLSLTVAFFINGNVFLASRTGLVSVYGLIMLLGIHSKTIKKKESDKKTRSYLPHRNPDAFLLKNSIGNDAFQGVIKSVAEHIARLQKLAFNAPA